VKVALMLLIDNLGFPLPFLLQRTYIGQLGFHCFYAQDCGVALATADAVKLG